MKLGILECYASFAHPILGIDLPIPASTPGIVRGLGAIHKIAEPLRSARGQRPQRRRRNWNIGAGAASNRQTHIFAPSVVWFIDAGGVGLSRFAAR